MAAHLFSQLLQKRDQLGRAVLLDNHHPLVAGDHQVKIGGGLHHAVELVVGDGGEAQRVVGLHMVGVEGVGQHDVLHGGVGVVGLLLHPGADEVKDQRGQHRHDEEGDPHRVVVREQGQQHQAGHHGAHIHGTVAALEVLHGDRDGLVFAEVERQVRQQVVVPDPHGFEDAHRDDRRLHNRHHDLEEDARH